MSYEFAKDRFAWEGYSGPAWVPASLWHCYRHPHFRDSAEKEGARAAAHSLIFSVEAETLWAQIYKACGHPDRIASSLPTWCAYILSQWRDIPKGKPSDYTKRVLDLADAVANVREEMNALGLMPSHAFELHFGPDTESMKSRIEHHNRQVRNRARVSSGLSEQSAADYANQNPRDFAKDRYDAEMLIFQSFPALEELLLRIEEDVALAAEPRVLKPNGPNAERNYFVRCLAQYFRGHGESPSPVMIARITSIFHKQGISENEVSQQLNRYPSGRVRNPDVSGGDSPIDV